MLVLFFAGWLVALSFFFSSGRPLVQRPEAELSTLRERRKGCLVVLTDQDERLGVWTKACSAGKASIELVGDRIHPGGRGTIFRFSAIGVSFAQVSCFPKAFKRDIPRFIAIPDQQVGPLFYRYFHLSGDLPSLDALGLLSSVQDRILRVHNWVSGSLSLESHEDHLALSVNVWLSAYEMAALHDCGMQLVGALLRPSINTAAVAPRQESLQGVDGTMAACLVCGDLLVTLPIVQCSRCDTPHHEECWSYAQGCAIYGCSAGTKIEATVVDLAPLRDTAPSSAS